MSRYQCPESHRHDASTHCYQNHGCRCDPCRARTSAQKRGLPYTTTTKLTPRGIRTCDMCGTRVYGRERITCTDCVTRCIELWREERRATA